jgi:hypothetical protein
MLRWLSRGVRPSVVTRSLKVGLVVGTILALINYTDRIVGGAMTGVDWLKLALTYLVPYCVSTYASIAEMISNENE